MRYVLFATAGHVDHGKTTLIKKLTGIDTDRLPEEKKRGLSIDLGFAYLDFPELNLRLELIDVPGHERFIKNAIAGLSSVSGFLLVVDAGEGVMPQTREHMQVAKSLGIKHGVAVLTKIDKNPKELTALAQEELEEFLKEEGFEIPIVRVSATTGKGIEELKKVLSEQAQRSLEKKEELPLRVVIDSAFTVKGHGTVLRGSCVEGWVKEGDKVIVEPIGKPARIRRIQNHGRFVREAEAGERVALNLPEVETDEVERGFLVLKPNTYVKGRSLIISTEAELRDGRVYYTFFGMREVRGRFSPIGEGLYILRLDEEVVARRGDRFVILDSTGRLAGGGEVLHPAVRVRKKRFIREKAELLKENFEAYLLKEMGTEGLSGELFRRMTGRAPNTGRLESISLKVGNRFYHIEMVELLKEKLRSMVDERLTEGSLGVPKAEVLERLGLSNELLEHLVSELPGIRLVGEYILDEKRSELEKDPDFVRVMEILKEGIKEEKELLGASVRKDVLQIAIKRKRVHRLGEFLIISDELLREYIKQLRELGESFTVQEAKGKLGLTRKYLIPLLEYLDYLGLTERRENERIWRA